ncbi:MAG: type II toxin-antitoxin system HipA family toxin [Oscillospiraceae bacterium]|nr:type II toxin-antitoxin system HipA family toxin [Oscillospiraceae bacterium]
MTAAKVILWGTQIGTVALPDDSKVAVFKYDRGFLESGIEVSPIVMPLDERTYSFAGLPMEAFHGLPGLLADALPDRFGNAVIDRWLAEQGREPASFNAVERLCYTGTRGMGALEFRPTLGPRYALSEKLNVDRLAQLASDILMQRESIHLDADADAMRQILQVGTSAGGARAKAVIAWNEQTNEIRSGQIDAGSGFGYWLIKFDGVRGNGDRDIKDPPVYTRIEYAYYLMAKAAGIEMSECRLYRENDLFHFMTKRFDREAQNGRKLHMQTLGALAHFDYNDPNSYSYEQAAMILRKLGLNSDSMEQLFRRMAFNVLAKNQDDHVKNISFLMDRSGRWSLAPAYDMTLSYLPGHRWLGAHQMSVNGKRSEITDKDLLSCGAGMDLFPAKCRRILQQIKAAVDDWDSYAAQAFLPRNATDQVKKLLEQT